MKKQVAIVLVILVSLVTSLVAGIGDTKEQTIASIVKYGGGYQIMPSKADGTPAAILAYFPDNTFGIHAMNANGVTIACGAILLVRPDLDWFKATITKLYPHTAWELVEDDGEGVCTYTTIDHTMLVNLVYRQPYMMIFSTPGNGQWAGKIAWTLANTVIELQKQKQSRYGTPSPAPVSGDKLIRL